MMQTVLLLGLAGFSTVVGLDSTHIVPFPRFSLEALAFAGWTVFIWDVGVLWGRRSRAE